MLGRWSFGYNDKAGSVMIDGDMAACAFWTRFGHTWTLVNWPNARYVVAHHNMHAGHILVGVIITLVDHGGQMVFVTAST